MGKTSHFFSLSPLSFTGAHTRGLPYGTGLYLFLSRDQTEVVAIQFYYGVL